MTERALCQPPKLLKRASSKAPDIMPHGASSKLPTTAVNAPQQVAALCCRALGPKTGTFARAYDVSAQAHCR